MDDTDLKWRKASYGSNGGGNCVEVADHDNRVLVRDTKNRQGPILRFTPEAWRRFADQVQGRRALGFRLSSALTTNLYRFDVPGDVGRHLALTCDMLVRS